MEWPFVAARIGRYAQAGTRVLDFGAGNGLLSMVAASLSARVVAIDLLERRFPGSYPNIEFRQTDVMDLDGEKERFDLVLNCSTLEHVGLSGRYNSREAQEGDIEAMAKLRQVLAPQGHMLLVLPVGQDQTISPLHRIYGAQRLPRVLEGFEVLESVFWRKDEANVWRGCTREQAQNEEGNDRYYALGCFVLRHAR